MKKHAFIRQKELSRYSCRYKNIDLIEYSEEEQQAVRKNRRTKSRASPPKIKKLNDDYSRKYFKWLLQNNFDSNDYHLTLTFTNTTPDKPPDKKDAKREFDNFIKRVRRLYQKKEAVFKYLYVQEGKTGGKRLHYHVVISGGVPREQIEQLWRLGYANADRLQPDEKWLTALSKYLSKSKNSAGKFERSWNGSHNLKRPDKVTDDSKVTKIRMRKLLEAARNDELNEFVERMYKGWKLIEHDVGENPVTGRPYARLGLLRKESG